MIGIIQVTSWRVVVFILEIRGFVSVERGRLMTNQILSKCTRQLMCLQLNTVDLQFMLYILLARLEGAEKVSGFRYVLCVKPASRLNRVLVYVVFMTSNFVFLLLCWTFNLAPIVFAIQPVKIYLVLNFARPQAGLYVPLPISLPAVLPQIVIDALYITDTSVTEAF